MKKRLLFMITGLLIVMALVGCSSQEEDELVEFQNNYKENVADPITDIASQEEEKEYQLEAGEIDEEEFISFLEDDFLKLIQEKRTYIDDYPVPETDVAKDYKQLMDDSVLATIDLLEQNADFLIEILSDPDMTEDEIMEQANNLDQLFEEVAAKSEALEKRQSELEEEHNIEFEQEEE